MKKAEKVCRRNTSRGHRTAQKRKLRRARRAAERAETEAFLAVSHARMLARGLEIAEINVDLGIYREAGTRLRDFTRGWTD